MEDILKCNIGQEPNNQAEPQRSVSRQNIEKTQSQPVIPPLASASLLGPDSIAYLKKGSKLILLVESESQAKLQYNSSCQEHRERFIFAWGQVLPRRIDGVYPDDKDWRQKIPHLVQAGKENGSVVYRQL